MYNFHNLSWIALFYELNGLETDKKRGRPERNEKTVKLYLMVIEVAKRLCAFFVTQSAL